MTQGVWRDAVLLGDEDDDITDVSGGLTNDDGRPTTLTQDQLNPLWTPDGDRPDPQKMQVRCPPFADHPIPRVKQLLWWCANYSGIDPPWRIRVSAQFAAIYTLRRISQALAPHATIVVDPNGRLVQPLQPGYDITFEFEDQRSSLSQDRPIGSRIVTARA